MGAEESNRLEAERDFLAIYVCTGGESAEDTEGLAVRGGDFLLVSRGGRGKVHIRRDRGVAIRKRESTCR